MNTTREQLLSLRSQHNNLLAELKQTEDKIKFVKATCDHDYHYIGHGHNEDYYECRHCNDLKTE